MKSVKEVAAAVRAKFQSPEYLKARRESLGLTQEDIAKAAGGSCSANHISYFENGSHNLLSEYGLEQIPKAYAKAEAAKAIAAERRRPGRPKNTAVASRIAELRKANKGPKAIALILSKVDGIHMS